MLSSCLLKLLVQWGLLLVKPYFSGALFSLEVLRLVRVFLQIMEVYIALVTLSCRFRSSIRRIFLLKVLHQEDPRAASFRLVVLEIFLLPSFLLKSCSFKVVSSFSRVSSPNQNPAYPKNHELPSNLPTQEPLPTNINTQTSTSCTFRQVMSAHLSVHWENKIDLEMYEKIIPSTASVLWDAIEIIVSLVIIYVLKCETNVWDDKIFLSTL